MNKTATWQRLNTALALLILLLIIGVGLALWVEKSHSTSELRKVQLDHAKARLYLDMVQMSDGLRGLLLGTKNVDPQKQLEDARSDLSSTIYLIQPSFPEQSQLNVRLRNLLDFSLERLIPFQNQVIELAATNSAGAIALYNEKYPALRQQRQAVLDDLNAQMNRVRQNEDERARIIAIAGLSGIVLILAASILVVGMQSVAVARPLAKVVETLEKMRRGDFTQRLALDGHDEFHELGEGLNRLADDLSALVAQVQRSGIQVNVTVTQIAATAKEQQSTASEIAATTAEIGATSKEISATSKELVKTMNEVSNVAEDTTSLANSGQIGIARMEATMRQLMEASSSITAKLAVLSDKTANINSVITTITKVADQTNLLSLNAAIEAEKAGEYGLGFAVVAMEIRRLADQTAVATYDIEKMVKEMQSAVAAGVMGMDKFSEEVRHGVEEIRQVSTQLAQIIHQVQTLTPRFQTVNEGMHAQATGAQQISETLTQLSEAAQQTAESLRQSNLAIEQLNDAARGLQTSVARFKLES